MKVTVNQIRRELQEIADAHYQVNSFFWGDFLRAYKEEEQKYPLVCTYLTTANMQRKLVPATLQIIVCDRTLEGLKNINDTESDCLQVIRDIYNTINMSNRWRKMVTVRSATANKFIERGGDVVAGYVLQIQIDIKDGRSICNLPLKDYDFETSTQPACPPALIVDSAGNQLGEAPADSVFTVPDSVVKNSDESYIVNVLAASTLILADTPVTIKNSEGTVIGAGTVLSITGGDVVAGDARVTNSDLSYVLPVPAGKVVALPDEDITLNGGAFLTKPSVKDQDIILQEPDTTPIVPDSVVGNIITVSLGGIVLNSGELSKTGQTNVQRPGDDGTNQAGSGTDFFTLDGIAGNWPHNSLIRHIDDTAAQVYTNEIMVDMDTYDQATGTALGYYLGDDSVRGWNAFIDWALALNTGGHSDWRAINQKEMDNLYNWGVATAATNWAPLNTMTQNMLSGGRYKWTGNEYPANPARRMRTDTALWRFADAGIASSYRCIAVRNYTLAELGL